MENQPLQRCDNCLKDFPQSKIATHFGYCRRNIKKCPQCHEMYDINFKEEHDQQYHKQETCPHCTKSFPSAEFKAHEKNCTQKPKYCQYCDLNVPVNTYPTHLKACEARTKPCTKCNLPITNKDYLIHIVSCEGPKQQPRPTRNYQQHIQQQRRLIEQNSNNIQKVNSRQKINVPSYQPRNAQYKDYAPYAEKRNVQQQPKVVTYNPTLPKQEIKVQDRKQYLKQQPIPNRIQAKKEEVRRTPNTVNPPPIIFTNNTKKQDPKPIGRISGNVPSSNPYIIAQSSNTIVNRNQIGNKGYGSRQPIKQNARSRQQQLPSYKEINRKIENPRENPRENPKAVIVKQRQSIEKKYGQPVAYRKEQKLPINNYEPPQRIKVPQINQRVIYQDSHPQPRQQTNQYQRFEHQGYGIEDDPQLQMAIMQSLGQGGKGSKNSSYTFQNEEFNKSFIEQQKAIEAQLKKNKKR